MGIDRVIERAGVAKASLYSAFGSKDEHVRAYLERHFRERQAHLAEVLSQYDAAKERLLALFIDLEAAVASLREARDMISCSSAKQPMHPVLAARPLHLLCSTRKRRRRIKAQYKSPIHS